MIGVGLSVDVTQDPPAHLARAIPNSGRASSRIKGKRHSVGPAIPLTRQMMMRSLLAFLSFGGSDGEPCDPGNLLEDLPTPCLWTAFLRVHHHDIANSIPRICCAASLWCRMDVACIFKRDKPDVGCILSESPDADILASVPPEAATLSGAFR